MITKYGCISALGVGSDSIWKSLQQGSTGLKKCDFSDCDLDTYVGAVDGVQDQPVDADLKEFDCRNNRIAQLGLYADEFNNYVSVAKQKYGASRIATVLGTSTSGVQECELAYRARVPETKQLPDTFRYVTTHQIYSLTEFVRSSLGLQGPCSLVSTACSSSAKVFAVAKRMMSLGLCDAAVVGGADSLCLTTLYGFSSLELVSNTPCKPWSKTRNGLSLGEGAGFAFLEKPEHADTHMGVALYGYGESSDGYHMSSPHPEGKGASAAMEQALIKAGIETRDVDYINLHGTATKANDEAEDKAILALGLDTTPCSSTKGWYGHTLGAAGILEAITSFVCIQHGFIPKTLNSDDVDPDLQANIQTDSRQQKLKYVLSNSFGFGGSNCSLIFGTFG